MNQIRPDRKFALLSAIEEARLSVVMDLIKHMKIPATPFLFLLFKETLYLLVR
jgi:hypothetical protein